MLADLDFITSYLDDILIKSKNQEDHAKHVTEVFKKIKEIKHGKMWILDDILIKSKNQEDHAKNVNFRWYSNKKQKSRRSCKTHNWSV